MAARAACLLSLGTHAYNRRTISALAAWQQAHGATLTFVELDQAELINQRILGLSFRRVSFFKGLISDQCWAHAVEYRQMSEWVDGDLFRRLDGELQRRFEQSSEFRGACKSQVFKSLQPRLNALGVMNQRHAIVEPLSRYVIMELALLVLLRLQEGIDTEVSLHRRMLPRSLLEQEPAGSLPLPTFEHIARDDDVPRLELDRLVVSIANSGLCVGPISHRLAAGSVLGLLGPNGSGKTTLLRAIAGHVKPHSGQIRISGVVANQLSPYDRRAATVFQDHGLFPEHTANENIDVGFHRLTADRPDESDAGLEERTTFDEHFKTVAFLDTKASRLSGGQRQIAAIGRAAVSMPALLLLDEPTASLDQLRKRRFLTYIREYCEVTGTAAVLVSHDREALLSACDSLLVLDERGRQIASGSPRDFLETARSLTAASIIGLANVFEACSGADGALTISHPGIVAKKMHSPLTDVRGIYIPPCALRQIVPHGKPVRQPGLRISGWISSISHDEDADLLFIRSRWPGGGARQTRLLMLTTPKNSVRILDAASVTLFANASDIVILGP